MYRRKWRERYMSVHDTEKRNGGGILRERPRLHSHVEINQESMWGRYREARFDVLKRESIRTKRKKIPGNEVEDKT
jgi:hypothetical protein